MKNCTKCRMDKEFKEFCKDKTSRDGYQFWCKACLKSSREHRKEESNRYTRNYNKINKKILSEKHKEYYHKKYSSDINYKIKYVLRGRLNKALKGLSKDSTTMELLGCTLEQFKLYIEKQFIPIFTWENYGKIWELDHIIPCSNFNFLDPSQQQKCFHYSNFQPLFKTTEIAESFGYNQTGNRNKQNKMLNLI
jgi:hypothetical protein